MKDISKEIGLIRLCFSGHHQEQKFQTINTELLNDLFYTIENLKFKINMLDTTNKKPMPSIVDMKEKRKKIGKSLREVAKESNLSASTISRIENGGDCDFKSAKCLYDYYAKNDI